MHGLTANTLLSLWDTGAGLHSLDRALLVLEAALPEMNWETLAATPLIQRDMWLLEAREKTFGSQLDGYAECPACSERLEFSLDTRAIHPDIAALDANAVRTLNGSAGGISFRLPNSLDLAFIAGCADADSARTALLGRVIVDGHIESAETLDAISTAINQWSEPADFSFELVCAACGHEWETLLDIGGYLWTEIERSAKRLLREVDVLARAYGWRESDVLALSPTRRAAYIQMALS